MIVQLISHFADTCTLTGSFLGFPTWYSYLPGTTDANNVCSPQFTSLSDVWLIVAAIIEILLRLAALVAIVMVIYGGVEFITSQGESEKAAKARSTVINALIGLVIAVGAAAIISFIAGGFNAS
jgi:hypothetical protein